MTHRPSGDETRDALAAVLEDQATRKERREAPPPTPRDWSGLARWAALPLGIVAVWFLVAPPAVLRPPVPHPTPEAVETGLVMDIYIAAVQVTFYRRQNGRLPETLGDALAEPDAAGDLTYTASPPDFFQIRGERAGQRVVYYSNQPLGEFVAAARAAVEAGSGS